MAYQLALVLDNLGDRAGERAALEQAIEANPHFVLAQYQLGYMDFQAGDNAGAERQFRLTVEEVPDNTQAWISLAAALGAESRFERSAAGGGSRSQARSEQCGGSRPEPETGRQPESSTEQRSCGAGERR